MSSNILVETSARHVHLNQEAIDALFGPGFSLTVKKELSQPGEFASDQRVGVLGPKGEIKNVIILGPARPNSQVELSLSDARVAGVKAPIRESGDVAGSAGCTLVGPYGNYELAEGVIAAKRHIHLTEADAATFGVENKEIVSVKIDTSDRSLVFGDVVCRVSDKFATAMHIDTDESNAVGGGPLTGTIIK
ncbi:PduL/EutD family phosphate acyltransferase [Tannockella kyphosi]|uniref:PduL/EutD family phosphate acyltransferase n=1 Tax=Tannockella kyphosi TaxID=2899121 RepID=UPI0020124E36|nr:phosphate propanoyltransferase [Tannockella kyphosi]